MFGGSLSVILVVVFCSRYELRLVYVTYFLRLIHTRKKANANSKKAMNNRKRSNENKSKIKENFYFRIRFHSVWTDPYLATYQSSWPYELNTEV